MKIRNIAFSALLATALFASCSNIDEDERLIYIEPTAAERNVLIEDFTGQRCVNCPKATIAIHEMQETFGENVIAVAIHCGPFGFAGNKKNIGLMNDTGKEYWDAWFSSTQGQPVAKINRGAATESYNDWSGIVRTELAKSTSVKIDATFKVEGKQATIDVSTIANSGRKGKLQVWLTEDNIVALQSQPDGSVDNEYVHNHVFRAAVNGTWGEDIVYTEAALEKSYTYTLADDWKAENMHAVIFVYDDEGVQQVIQQGVTLAGME